ncbi:putative RNA helicase transcription factor interactor and regulator CCHC(Zn) family protein [Tanacetum coccineum]
MEHYCPQSKLDQIAEEFLMLKQGNKTVEEITAKFFEKMCFAPLYASTESMKMKRYLLCLKTEICEFLITSRPKTLAEMIDAARERGIKIGRQTEKVKDKRKWESTNNSSKRYINENLGKKFDNRSNIRNDGQSCKKCRKYHKGECLAGLRGCYKCRKLGHNFQDCKNESRLCFNCNQPGHMRHECPKLRNANTYEHKPMRIIDDKKKIEAPRPKGHAF